MAEFYLAVRLMGYGLAGVFSVLILFYLVIHLLVKFFPPQDEKDPPKA